MSEPTAAPSTGLVRIDPLSPARREQVHMRKLVSEVAGEIGKLSWGKNLEEQTRKALAHWGEEHHVDVVTEVDMLGGKPYLNSHFYLRKLGDLIAQERVEYVEADFCHVDPRLDAQAKAGDADAVTEKKRREQVRIRHGIPDAATGACVFRLKLHVLRREIVGVNWCGGGTGNHKAGGKGDPVGDMEPVKTAESRAARRCLRQAASHIPAQAALVEATVHSLEALGTMVRRDEAQAALPSGASHRGVKDVGYDDDPGREARDAVRGGSGVPLTPPPVTDLDDLDDLALDREIIEREGAE